MAAAQETIRTTCRAKWVAKRQTMERRRLIVALAEHPKASYTDRNEDSRILCGAI